MIGIYKITNLINGKKYYGSSVDIGRRWRNHKLKLNNSTHNNPHLQNSWNKYEEENFTFEIILLCEEFELEYYEQWFLDNVVKWGVDYNVVKIVSGQPDNNGRSCSQETKNKIRDSLRGRKRPQFCGENNPMYGKKHSEETRKLIGNLQRGESSTKSKLKVLEVLIIRELLSTKKYSQRKLGKMFNVSHGTIGAIDKRETWRHI